MRLHEIDLNQRLRQIALSGCALWASTAGAQAAPLVTVSDGALSGVSQGAVDKFLGVPYAKAPVGQFRWASPQAPEPWAGVRSAAAFGASCPQDPADALADGVGSKEDCLTLNVFAPNGPSTKPRPVIVFIHGGGFVLGGSRQYDGTQMAETTQAVVVTMNYRLGALGLLWTSGMAEAKRGANFTLQDQQAALRWVQTNIARFNGDPGNVTLSGQSVGGMSVSAHLVSPTASKLFHKAVMLSGILPPKLASSRVAADQGDAFAAKLGCPADADQMNCLRNKSTAEILAQSQRFVDITNQGIQWLPFIDGVTLPADALAAASTGRFNKVPVIVSTTRDEGTLFVSPTFHMDGTPTTQEEYVNGAKTLFGPVLQPLLTNVLYTSQRLGSPAKAYAQMMTDGYFSCLANELVKRTASQVPTYAYEFADRQAPRAFEDPFLPLGAYHLSDLPYLFQTTVAGFFGPKFTPEQWRLSNQMIRYLARFAATGNPNAEDDESDPRWLRFEGKTSPYLTLAPGAIATQKPGEYSRAHQCGFWSLAYSLKR